MKRNAALTVLAAVLAAALSSCTVMKSTYQKKSDEVDALARRYADLEARYAELSAENAALKTKGDRLAADLAYVTDQRDKVARDKEELNALLKARSDALSQNVYELRGKVEALEAENARLEKENAQLAKAKEEQVRKVSTTYEDLLEKMKTEIAQGQVTISELKGKLTVNMVDSILFESGRAEVKKAGGEILRKVVPALKGVEDKSIRIEGHTDNVQISAALASRYPTNWELSAARAINVTRFLQEQGLDPARLSAVGYGEWKPVADNSTPEGRAKNRRIEINLVERDQR
ncbi:MAG: OmpA family protein [Thermodesulfobacteriota bacterium]